MSYSIVVRGKTKAETRHAAEEKFDRDVVSLQPVHAQDRAVAMANVDAVLGHVAEPEENQGVVITMFGSISGAVEPATGLITRVSSLNVGCTIYLETLTNA